MQKQLTAKSCYLFLIDAQLGFKHGFAQKSFQFFNNAWYHFDANNNTVITFFGCLATRFECYLNSSAQALFSLKATLFFCLNYV